MVGNHCPFIMDGCVINPPTRGCTVTLKYDALPHDRVVGCCFYKLMEKSLFLVFVLASFCLHGYMDLLFHA